MGRGFKVAWGIFSAKDVGAPHLRRRWYCLATRDILLPMLSHRAHDWVTEEAPRVGSQNSTLPPRSAAESCDARQQRGPELCNSCIQRAESRSAESSGAWTPHQGLHHSVPSSCLCYSHASASAKDNSVGCRSSAAISRRLPCSACLGQPR